jgi:hypothetical protein
MSNNTIILSADDSTAAPLVATIRAAVNGNGKYAAYVTAHGVTRETVKDHAAALAVLAYPKDAPVQKKDGKRTRFGNAVQAAGNGLRGALDKKEGSAPTNLLTTLGKSSTLDEVVAAWKAEQN